MADLAQDSKLKDQSKRSKETGYQRSAISSGNVPCMALLQFTYRSKKLHLTAYFRSNDMFDAWPRNSFALRKLQFDFAKRIGKKPGYLTTISNCAQIYEQNYEKANRILTKYKDKPFCRPDPRSTIIIEIQGKEILARHMTPDGNQQLDEFRIDGGLPKAGMRMIDKLIANDVFSTEGHIADIAIELAKAEWCLKNGRNYIQDKDWEEWSSHY
jgi:thymidylate synthase